MNVHYKEHKSPIGLSGKWAIPIGNYHIDCFVWVNKDGLLENVAHEDEDYVACYVHFPSRRLSGGLFGEIHVMETEVNPGNIAHELTHVLFDWCNANSVSTDTNRGIEMLCETMEDLTRTYWEEYFKVFMVEKGQPEVENPAVSDVANSPEPEQNPEPVELEETKGKNGRRTRNQNA